MKKAMIFPAVCFLAVISARPALSQQVRKMTFDASTTVILLEANVILTEAEDAVTVMTTINNIQPEGTPKVDLKKDDVVMGLNGKRIKTVKEFHALYDELKPKTTIKLAVKRGEDLFFVSFPKINPEDLPGGGTVMKMQADGGRVSANERSVYYGENGYNAGGYTVIEEDGRLEVGILLAYKKELLGDIDIQSGDVIRTLNGKPVGSLESFVTLYGDLDSGSSVILGTERDGALRTVSYEKPKSVTRSIQMTK